MAGGGGRRDESKEKEEEGKQCLTKLTHVQTRTNWANTIVYIYKVLSSCPFCY